MGKLHTLHWAMKTVAQFGTMNRITAQFVFVEGMRCAEGLNQMDFFRKKLKPVFSDDAAEEEDDEAEAVEVEEADDDGVEEFDEDHPPTAEQVERGRRRDAVEQRAEYGTDCVMLILMHAAQDIAGELINTWEAFGRFSRTRIGIEPDVLLRAWGPSIADNLEATIQRFAHLKAGEEKVEEYQGLICRGWDRRFNS